MPGSGRIRFEWVEKTPLYLKVVIVLLIAENVVSWVLFDTVPRWAQSVPDILHPVELHRADILIFFHPQSAGI